VTVYHRAKILGSGHAPGLGTFQVTYQLCPHEHVNRGEALRCELGGDYLYERTKDQLVELRLWERANGAPLTIEQARTAVSEAMVSVDPRLAEETQHAQAWANVEQRGNRFDVTIYHADGLFSRFEAAIRDALRPSVDLVQENYD
jgi:hypothetical protein